MKVEEILKEVKFKHVVVTGGEPTYWNLDELIGALKVRNHYVQLETSGQNNLKGTWIPDWVTWSPKKNLSFKAPFELMRVVDEVKFVVDRDLTLEEVWDCLDPILEIAKDQPKHPHITMMPEGSPPTLESMEKAMTYTQALSELTTRPVRFSDRLQYRLGVK